MRFKFLFLLLFCFFGFVGHSLAQQADPAGFIDPTQQQKEPKKKVKKTHRKIHWFWKKRTANEMSQRQLEQTFKKSKRNIREENQTYRAHYKSTHRQHKAYAKRRRKGQHHDKKTGGGAKKKLKWG
jgi:hypothetical protein